jgi:hypothetical protein
MQALPELPNAATIARQHFPILSLPSPFRELFGEKLPRPPHQWTMLMFGDTGSGKSSLALKFAKELAKTTGKYVLYNANQEPLESNSVNIRLKSLGIHDPRIHILDARNFHTLKLYLATGKYAYCFVDSLNKLRHEPFLITNSIQHILEEMKKYGTEKDKVFKWVSQGSLSRDFNSILSGCGIEKKGRNFHALRKTAATRWAEQGIPLQEVQKLLGHTLKQRTTIM